LTGNVTPLCQPPSKEIEKKPARCFKQTVKRERGRRKKGYWVEKEQVVLVIKNTGGEHPKQNHRRKDLPRHQKYEHAG